MEDKTIPKICRITGERPAKERMWGLQSPNEPKKLEEGTVPKNPEHRDEEFSC
jgi:hypothetical protein